MEQLWSAAAASPNLSLNAHVAFSGALAWPFFYPWPQRPAGLIDGAFKELGLRWVPISNAFDEAGVDLCFALHPGEDLHDGATFEHFVGMVGDHLVKFSIYLSIYRARFPAVGFSKSLNLRRRPRRTHQI